MRATILATLLAALAVTGCAGKPLSNAGGAKFAPATAAERAVLPELRAAMVRIEHPKARNWCTGILVAPDLVATAGHCMLDIDQRELRFRAETGGAPLPGTEILASGIRLAEQGDRRTGFIAGTQNDWALLRVPGLAGTPLPVQAMMPSAISQAAGAGTQIRAAGYHAGELRAIGPCPLDPAREFGFFVIVCPADEGRPAPPVTFGDSGGPVVLVTPDGPRLIGLISNGGNGDGKVAAASATEFVRWLE